MQSECATPLNASFKGSVAVGGGAEKVVGIVIGFLNFFNFLHIVVAKLDGAVAQQVDEAAAQFVHTEGEKIFQQRDATSDTFHTL